VDILGPRPFPHKKNVLDYLDELRERDAEEDVKKEETETEPESQDGEHDEDKSEPQDKK